VIQLQKDYLERNSHLVNVTIKSTKEASIKDINKVITDNKSYQKMKKEADIVIVHTIINNISNAHTPQSICKESNQLISYNKQ
jgi:hypothetical protein